MRSAARLTYHEVGAFLEKPGARHSERLEKLRERLLGAARHLQVVHARAQRARRARARHAGAKLKFDAQGRIAALVEHTRNDAHRLIEECMIAANVAAARFLDRNRVPTLYRVHGLPEIDRLETLRTFLRDFGIWLPPPDEIKPEHLRDLLQQIGDRPGRAPDPDRRRAFDAAGGLSARQHRPFRPGAASTTRTSRRRSGVIRICVVHRGIRHVLRSGDPQELSRGTGRSRCSDRIARFASGAPTRRRATRWPGSSATTCRTSRRGVRRHRHGRRRLRPVRAGRRHAGRRTRARVVARRRLLRPRQLGLPHGRSQLRPGLPARRSPARAPHQRLVDERRIDFELAGSSSRARRVVAALPASRQPEKALMPRRQGGSRTGGSAVA